jgi:hypothetical protein
VERRGFGPAFFLIDMARGYQAGIPPWTYGQARISREVNVIIEKQKPIATKHG